MDTKQHMQDGGVAVIQLPSPDSLSTASVKEYAPSFSSEPPPAYQKPRSTAVQVARIAGITLVAASAILGTFLLAAAWVNTRYSCAQHVIVPMPVSHTQNHEQLPSFDRLVDPLKAEEQKIEEKKVEEVGNELKDDEESKPTTEKSTKKEEEPANEDDSEEDEEEDGSDQNSEEIPIQIRLPLQLDFDELAGMLMERNMRSRMNCIVEKKRAEEIVDHHPRTLQLPFGLNLTTDPRHERVTGERMAIFCESGHDQMQQQQHPRQELPFEIFPIIPEQRQQHSGPVVVPLPGPIHLPFQFVGPLQQPQPQMPHPPMPFPPMHPHQMPFPQMPHPQMPHPQMPHPQMRPQEMRHPQMLRVQMPHPQMHPEIQHQEMHPDMHHREMHPEMQHQDVHHQEIHHQQIPESQVIHRNVAHPQQSNQQPPHPQAPHLEEPHLQGPVHTQQTIHIITPFQQGPTMQQIQQQHRQEEILRRQLLEQEALESLRPPPPPAPSAHQLPPQQNSERHMPQMGPFTAHGPFVMELTEINPEEMSNHEAVPMGRAMRGPMPQRLPVHLPNEGNIRGPAVEDEEEHRPHYVQPRSVPSDPFAAELHKRDKRVKKRCACDCSC